MLDKDKKMKSVVFLVIGIIFLLSLVVCIYITYIEKDLKETTAEITNYNVSTGNKKNYSIVYTVNGVSYSSSFYTDDTLMVGDNIKLFYHEKDATTAKLYKTSLIIFLCPIVGLVLCIVGLIKIFKKSKNDIKVIEESNEDLALVVNEPSKIVDIEETDTEENEIDDEVNVIEEQDEIIDENSIQEEFLNFNNKNESSIVSPSELPFKPSAQLEPIKSAELPVKKFEEINDEKTLTEIKTEANESIEKKINQVNVLPNNYYISGVSLVYEEFSKRKEEIALKDIDQIVVTINSVGNVVKLVVYTEKIKCILTKMKNIDLDKMVNSLKYKMNVIKKDFEETIEYKEY